MKIEDISKAYYINNQVEYLHEKVDKIDKIKNGFYTANIVFKSNEVYGSSIEVEVDFDLAVQMSLSNISNQIAEKMDELDRLL